jgi:hypothetical protein
MIDLNKVNKLLQYIIIVAGQEDDPFSRQLGPIHLIKYLYLADLSYAESHEGQTYTGLQWKFHHYGPWAEEAYNQIEPALSIIYAEKQTIPSTKYEDDFYRWSKTNDDLCDDLFNELDLSVTGTINRLVHQYGSDTPRLLDYTYKTAPMLNAAPGDQLNFAATLRNTSDQIDTIEDSSCAMLTKRQEKKRTKQLLELKQKIRKKLESRRKESKQSFTPPRYDDVFFEGLTQLDSLAGEPITPGEYKAEFSEDVWKSKSRSESNLS